MTQGAAITPLIPETPAEAASHWFALRRRKPDCIEEQQFAEWLEADPANRRAYDEVTRSWEISALAATDPTVVTMRTEALMVRPPKQRDFSRLWGALATAALMLIVFTGISLSYPGLIGSARDIAARRDQITLRTGIGERATATLDDGSTVVLNTNSTLEINYTRLRRDVRLLAGQVLFKVAHDAARPFVVAAANHEVVAVGTEFEVRLEGQNVRVALLQGRVRVAPITAGRRGPAAEEVAVMTPGEQLVASPAGMLVNRTDVGELVSWQSGRVRFDNIRLAEAVAEMNRYSRTRIVIDDPAAADIRITGAFRTGQSYSFAQTIGEAFPIEVEQNGDVIRLHSRS
ncbi:MAG TPA: FecR domain-containing protein [Sphingomicrobium sp.]